MGGGLSEDPPTFGRTFLLTNITGDATRQSGGNVANPSTPKMERSEFDRCAQSRRLHSLASALLAPMGGSERASPNGPIWSKRSAWVANAFSLVAHLSGGVANAASKRRYGNFTAE